MAVVGDYEIGPILGKGAFATVHKVKNVKDGKDYAMKVIKRSALNDDMLAKLKIEVGIMKTLQHPNAVHCYDILESDSRYMLVMDLISGGELLKQIKGPLTDDEAANYFIQIAGVLSYLQSVGISHRDLKFENILVGDDGRMVVTDFGLGQVSMSPDKTFFTCQTLCGTPQYIAPEVTDGKKYDAKTADLWSLGVILYTMMAYKFPFQDPDFGKIFELAHAGKYTMPVCQPETAEVIQMLLQPDFRKRGSIDQVMSSKFVTSRVKVVDSNTIQMNFKGCYAKPIVIKTRENGTIANLRQQVQGKVGGQTVEAGSEQCPFCSKDIDTLKKNDVANWPMKKGVVIAKATTIFESLSVIVASLRASFPTEMIVIDTHKLVVTIEGKVEVRLYKPGGKYFCSVGIKSEQDYKPIQDNIVKLQSAPAGLSLMRVPNISSLCQ